MMKKHILTSALMLGFSAGVVAQPDTLNYFGVDYIYSSYDENDFDEVNPSAIGVRLGRYVVPYVAVEGRAATGIGDDSVTVIGVPVDVEIDNIFSAFLRGNLPVTEQFSIYGLAGYSKAELTASAGGFSFEDDDDGFSWGAGIEINTMRNTAVGLEYVRYLDEDDYEFSGINLGVRVGF